MRVVGIDRKALPRILKIVVAKVPLILFRDEVGVCKEVAVVDRGYRARVAQERRRHGNLIVLPARIPVSHIHAARALPHIGEGAPGEDGLPGSLLGHKRDRLLVIQREVIEDAGDAVGAGLGHERNGVCG